MRLAISVFVSIVGVVHAYAADTYQIIPISISPEPGDASVYEAIVANTLTVSIGVEKGPPIGMEKGPHSYLIPNP